jgi:hypothetical protein
MINNFAVVEIGSTNTKGYIYKDNKINELGFKNIEFKKNYKKNNEIVQEDIESLYEYINKIKEIESRVFVFGTSIFRQISETELKKFKTDIEKTLNVSFEVVTADEENEYTVYGAIKDIGLDENIAVMIGGGGSTELAICRNGKIIEKANTSMGVVDINEVFPDLVSDISTVKIEDVEKFIESKFNKPKLKADILILAGGAHILRCEKVKYPIYNNNLYKDEDCPYLMNINEMMNYDYEFIHNISLNDLRKFTPDNPKWWDGTRAMCIFVTVISKTINAKYIIPTNISMVYGIIQKIKESN